MAREHKCDNDFALAKHWVAASSMRDPIVCAVLTRPPNVDAVIDCDCELGDIAIGGDRLFKSVGEWAVLWPLSTSPKLCNRSESGLESSSSR